MHGLLVDRHVYEKGGGERERDGEQERAVVSPKIDWLWSLFRLIFQPFIQLVIMAVCVCIGVCMCVYVLSCVIVMLETREKHPSVWL